MKLPMVQDKSVLITGCSSGIGAATATMLRERGWHVIPTARKEEDMERLKSLGFDPLYMDMANPDSVADGASETLRRTGGRLGGLVNNAGFGQSGALEDIKREHLKEQFEVNVFGLQDLTNRFIPVFRKQSYGRIVHVSSVVGRLSIPFLGAYSASKFAVEALGDAQRVELHGSGVGIILIEPGPITTQFRKNTSKRAEETLDLNGATLGDFYKRELRAREDQQKQPGWLNKAPEDVGKTIVHALESTHPRRRYKITATAHVGAFMSRFAPVALVDFLLSQKVPQQ